MRVRLATLLLVIGSMSMAGVAQSTASAVAPPSREQALELMTLLGVGKNVDAALTERESKITDSARGCFRDMNPGVDAATMKKLDAAFNRTPRVSFDDVAGNLVAAVQKNLTGQEVQTAIDFYQSEAGKKLRQVMPAILKQANAESGEIIDRKMRSYNEAINQVLSDFQNQQRLRKQAAPKPGATGKSSGVAHTGSI